MAPTTEPVEPTESERPPAKPRALALVLVVAIGATVYGLDQLTKHLVSTTLVEYQSVPVLGEFLQLTYVLNPGAAFSLASGYTWVLSIVALGVLVTLIWFSRRIRSLLWATMFGLVIGGALGNLTDRFFRPPGPGEGHVVDFIHFSFFPAIFNIADVGVVSAACLFVLLSLLGLRLDGTREPKRSKHEDEADAEAVAADEPTNEKSTP